MKTRFHLALAFATLALSTLTQAQAWPTKPVKIVVPYAPGGSVDVVTRKIAAKPAPTGGWIGGVFEPNLLDRQYAEGWGYGD